MKTLNELNIIINYRLDKSLDRLWDALTPEERKVVFPNLIMEYISSTY